MQPDAPISPVAGPPPRGRFRRLLVVPLWLIGFAGLYYGLLFLPLPTYLRSEGRVASAAGEVKVAKEKVDHVDIVFNAGHPGVAEPHYHIVLWYVSAAAAARLAK